VLREIVKYPDPVLERPSEPVTAFDDELRKLVDLSFQKNPEEKIVLINPEIIFREGKQYEEEGCLSLPEIREKVSRAAKVTVKAQDLKGEWFELDGEELLARAFQHEIDHLDGVLFFRRVSALKRDLILRRIRKMQRAGEW
jgi:peptide deformylase